MEKEQQQTAQSAGLIYGLNDRPPLKDRRLRRWSVIRIAVRFASILQNTSGCRLLNIWDLLRGFHLARNGTDLN